MSSQSQLIRNAGWNVIAGLSSAILTVAMPPLLTRLLSREEFGAWAFCLQVAGYVLLLNLGLQVVVGRFVASAEAEQDLLRRDQIVSTAFALLVFAGFIGLLVVWVLSLQLHYFVPNATPLLRREMAGTLLLLGTSFSLMLPTSVFGAVFVGLRRNAVYAATIIPMRLLCFAGVLIACWTVGSLPAMGFAWLLATIIGAFISFLLWRRLCDYPRMSVDLASMARLKELTAQGSTIAIWSLSGLMAGGLQTIVVGRYDYLNLGAFAIGSSIAMFVSGLMQAIANTAVPQAAHSIADSKSADALSLLSRMTLYSNLLGGLASIPLMLAAVPVMRLWSGSSYTPHSGLLLVILVLAQAIRNLFVVYTMTAVAAGLQHRIILTPLIEGFSGLVAGILLGREFGVIGVAIGWSLGSLVGATLLMAHDVIGRWEPGFRRGAFIGQAVLRPASGTIAAAIFGIILAQNHVSWFANVAAALVCIALSLSLSVSRSDLNALRVNGRRWLNRSDGTQT